MSINDPSKVNKPGAGQTGQTQAAAQPKSQEAPKTVWAGMTRSEATKYNLLDEFNKANTKPDDVLTEQEYNTYIKSKDAPTKKTSSSGKRVAVGGVYTVQSGDTLSKIAADFGIDTYDLFLINRRTMKSIDKLDVGQKIRIEKEERPKTQNGGAEGTQGTQQGQDQRPHAR